MQLIKIVIFLFLTGCSGMQSIESAQLQSNHGSTARTHLMSVYSEYRGTPYRYGGIDRNGFDCSGFINVAFNEAFGIKVPRTTENLAKSGVPIRRDQLKEGDIVFFKTSVKQLHAGIYTGSGNFIHASTSKGVIQSSLDNTYWHQRYLKARRYL